MSKKRDKKRARRGMEDPEAGGFTFGDLLRAKGVSISSEDLPEGPAPPENAPGPGGGAPEPRPELGSNLRLKLERKGRGGKTVTLLEGVALGGKELELFVKRLRKAMGSGAKIEGDTIVVQGDIRDRLGPWLEGQGAARVRSV